MKDIVIRSAACLLLGAAALLTVSCGRKQAFKTAALSYEDSLAVVTVTMPGEMPMLRISASVEYVTGETSEEVLNTVNGIISEVMFNETELTDVPQSAEKHFADIRADYRSACEEITDMVALDEDYPMLATINWAYVYSGKFLESYKNYIPYLVDNYIYTGGAHGGRTVICRNFNVKDGSAAAEDDIFIDGYETKLTRLLAEKAVEAVGEENTESLWTENIKPNGNFILSNDGIRYIFNQYEIAPYALGVIEIQINWDEIKDIVK